MDENKKNVNKTLRSYLVYDYIFKRSESKMSLNYFTTTQINEYLQTYGVYCDNRAIVRDIEAINQAYIMLREELDDIEEANRLLLDAKNQLVARYDLYSNSYYVNQENNHLQDWVWIAECIGAARFINEKETDELIELLCRHLHPKELEKIKDRSSKIQREKISSSLPKKNLKVIREALHPSFWFRNECDEVLKFYYLTYSIDRIGKPLEKQSKEYCIVHPHKILNHNGLYYLVAYDDTKRKMRVFRIDRMIKLTGEYDEKHSGIRLANKMDFATLAARTFDMCLGESTRVVIRCKNSAFDTIYERFGTENATYHRCDDNHFEVSVVLDVSPKFFGWLCGFGKDAKLISPPAVVDEFANYLDDIRGQY